jgi:hypothetical protein
MRGDQLKQTDKNGYISECISSNELEIITLTLL